MPAEERYIIFSYDEIHEALTAYAAEQNKEDFSIADGEIKNIELQKEKGSMAITTQSESGERVTQECQHEFLVMALIYCCLLYTSPSPRDA